MPSPFPGMNPYLEQADVWPDFHTRFLTALADAIGRQVHPRYFTRIEEQVYLHERSADERLALGRPDLSVLPNPVATATSATTSSLAPVIVQMPEAVDEIRVRSLEIRDRNDRQVVTLIELLSPSNKYAGPDREQYRTKIRRVLQSPCHVVELDFLRGGPRMPWIGMPTCDYYALVSRASQRPNVGFWPIRLREALPTIPIPLRENDTEPQVDLQSILHNVYDSAGYEFSIYQGSPEPLLSASDAAWASGLLAPAA
jgi:hypothetical protein